MSGSMDCSGAVRAGGTSGCQHAVPGEAGFASSTLEVVTMRGTLKIVAIAVAGIVALVAGLALVAGTLAGRGKASGTDSETRGCRITCRIAR
jgi:hypothetical protein